MNLDVRIPIGLMFSIVGLLLTVYGAVTLGEPGSQPTGLPIDIIWGIVLLVFGVGMLVLFRVLQGAGGGGHDRRSQLTMVSELKQARDFFEQVDHELAPLTRQIIEARGVGKHMPEAMERARDAGFGAPLPGL